MAIWVSKSTACLASRCAMAASNKQERRTVCKLKKAGFPPLARSRIPHNQMLHARALGPSRSIRKKGRLSHAAAHAHCHKNKKFANWLCRSDHTRSFPTPRELEPPEPAAMTLAAGRACNTSMLVGQRYEGVAPCQVSTREHWVEPAAIPHWAEPWRAKSDGRRDNRRGGAIGRIVQVG